MFFCWYIYVDFLTENGQNVFVTGAAGMGKSALLCNWISSLKQDSSRHAVVYHFIGFADGSTGKTSVKILFVLYVLIIVSRRLLNSF